MDILYENLLRFDWQHVVMILIGCLLIFLAIKKEMEPTLLLPMGFGCILCNMPNSGMVHTLEILFQAGVDNELFPLLLFIAAAIKLSSPGPVLFRQTRVGYNRKEFRMLKFRSMKVNDAGRHLSHAKLHWLQHVLLKVIKTNYT